MEAVRTSNTSRLHGAACQKTVILKAHIVPTNREGANRTEFHSSSQFVERTNVRIADCAEDELLRRERPCTDFVPADCHLFQWTLLCSRQSSNNNIIT
jgi:predicted metal-dependent phosphoesterase TrpH